jgi:L-2-hydroxyglutarate oxidase
VSSTDFLILGGGIIGLSIARELKHRFADAEITLLEKKLRVAFTPVVEIAG